jgi:hypothetical protein
MTLLPYFPFMSFDVAEPDANAPSRNDTYRIYVSTTAGQFTLLEGNVTLDHIHERYLKANKPLELFYLPEKSDSPSAKP